MKLEINLDPEKSKIITFYHDRKVTPITFYSEFEPESEEMISKLESLFSALPFEDPTGSMELIDPETGITYFIEKVVGGYSIGLILGGYGRLRKRRGDRR